MPSVPDFNGQTSGTCVEALEIVSTYNAKHSIDQSDVYKCTRYLRHTISHLCISETLCAYINFFLILAASTCRQSLSAKSCDTLYTYM